MIQCPLITEVIVIPILDHSILFIVGIDTESSCCIYWIRFAKVHPLKCITRLSVILDIEDFLRRIHCCVSIDISKISSSSQLYKRVFTIIDDSCTSICRSGIVLCPHRSFSNYHKSRILGRTTALSYSCRKVFRSILRILKNECPDILGRRTWLIEIVHICFVKQWNTAPIFHELKIRERSKITDFCSKLGSFLVCHRNILHIYQKVVCKTNTTIYDIPCVLCEALTT